MSDIPLNETVLTVRVVVHTLGSEGFDKSKNHWSIYLILEGNRSVRLNMYLADGLHEYGSFSVRPHSYTVTTSCLTYFDYNVREGLTVGGCLDLIYANRRQNYRMTGTGNGCRFWVQVPSMNTISELQFLTDSHVVGQFSRTLRLRDTPLFLHPR